MGQLFTMIDKFSLLLIKQFGIIIQLLILQGSFGRCKYLLLVHFM